MEESRDNSNSQSQHEYVPSSSFSSISASHSQGSEQHREHQHQEQQQQRQSAGVSYRVNISISDVASSGMGYDVWYWLAGLVTFWFFVASMAMILGIYGSVDLQVGPNYSGLIQANPFLVQSIKSEELEEPKSGSLMLYGFHKSPTLDVEISWTETQNAVVPVDFHKEWLYFLNKRSKVDISYCIKSPSSAPLSLVIAQGSDSLKEWIDDPSHPNTTLSWNIIYGSGKIHLETSESSNYYIAVGNLNSEEVEVQLNFTMNALIYNTTKAYYRCSLGNSLCILSLDLLGATTAVLTSSGLTEVPSSAKRYVKLSYGPRWITYFVASGVMTILFLLALRYSEMYPTTHGDGTGFLAGEVWSERVPLLSQKDDDLSSLGSSYGSVSHDDQDLEESIPVSSLAGNSLNEGETNGNPRRLCVICSDAPRDCFFLPCGHCAACFTCGTRIAEEAGTCPICRRTMKKVRKIFTV